MAAKECGVGIVTDAHSVEELRHMEFGVNQARYAGLEAGNVAKMHAGAISQTVQALAQDQL